MEKTMQDNEKAFTKLRINNIDTVEVQTLQPNRPWTLNKINRLSAGGHEIIFDVDGSPAIKLTVEGSLSFEGLRVESVAAAT